MTTYIAIIRQRGLIEEVIKLQAETFTKAQEEAEYFLNFEAEWEEKGETYNDYSFASCEGQVGYTVEVIGTC